MATTCTVSRSLLLLYPLPLTLYAWPLLSRVISSEDLFSADMSSYKNSVDYDTDEKKPKNKKTKREHGVSYFTDELYFTVELAST